MGPGPSAETRAQNFLKQEKAKSTASAGLVIQSILSRALDSNNLALMASIDLSAAFDLVNIDLLIGLRLNYFIRWLGGRVVD